jgi:hypothetical protein
MRGLKVRSADVLADWSIGINDLAGAGTVKETLDSKMPKSGGTFTGTVSVPDNTVTATAAVNLAQVEGMIAAIPTQTAYAGSEDVFVSDGNQVSFPFVNIPSTALSTPNRVFVFIDGIRQSRTGYGLNSTDLTLSNAAPLDSVIEVCLL